MLRCDEVILAADAKPIRVMGKLKTTIEIDGKVVTSECAVIEDMIRGVDFILGTDILWHFKFVLVRGKASICSVVSPKPVVMPDYDTSISGRNFEVSFDGTMWVAEWNWKYQPNLKNRTPVYKMDDNVRQKFTAEVERWIANGWLVKICRHNGGVIPLMAVVQQRKNKVRPVLDFREMNECVECSGADADVCQEKLRKWRQMPTNCALVDLRDAYMQVGVTSNCSKYQVVKFENEYYELKRMGFGLNCAPEIMKSIVSKVLSLNSRVAAATDHYYDDIIVDLDQVSVGEVVNLLRRYGLVCKPPERIDASAVLGLQMVKVNNQLRWGRSNDISFNDGMPKTKREVFSACGKLTGHYPIAGWLRVAASYVKRLCRGTHWDDYAGEDALKRFTEVLQKISVEDPVKGIWSIPQHGRWNIWCDASKIALGAVLEKNGEVVEDGAWLRKEDDGSHINLAELNAVVKGVNMALKWGVKSVVLLTDSASVFSWLSSLRTRDKKIRVSGLSEMLVKRRLVLLEETLQSYDVEWSVKLVPSHQNKADILTRVPREWLRKRNCTASAVAVENVAECQRNDVDTANRIHKMIHRGVESTLHFARAIIPDISRETVKNVVERCDVCRSIDPNPVSLTEGSLSVDVDWERIAIDVTHMGHLKYLTVIDCGPCRYALWREIKSESDAAIVHELKQVFAELGPPKEILCDNAKAFRSKLMGDLCQSWFVRLNFRCAYRPSGNAIIERHHRTIKTMCARTKQPIEKCVFWYNMIPHGPDRVVPSEKMFVRHWNNPFLGTLNLSNPEVGDSENIRFENETNVNLIPGDMVWVKPVRARCNSRWRSGVVSDVLSDYKVVVDGMPRHVKDIRKVVNPENRTLGSRSPIRAPIFWSGEGSEEQPRAVNEDEMAVSAGEREGEQNDENAAGLAGEWEGEQNDENAAGVAGRDESSTLRRSGRERRPPQYLSDFVVFQDD